MMHHRLTVLVALAFAGVAGLAALAQEGYPSRTIHIIVANAAGGGSDFLARLVGQKLQDRIGQSVVIENKPGANAMIAAQAVIKSPPDGHTLLLGSIGMLPVNPAGGGDPSYHTQPHLPPISHLPPFPPLLT